MCDAIHLSENLPEQEYVKSKTPQICISKLCHISDMIHTFHTRAKGTVKVLGSQNSEPFKLDCVRCCGYTGHSSLNAKLVASSVGPKYRSTGHYKHQSLHGCVSVTVKRW